MRKIIAAALILVAIIVAVWFRFHDIGIKPLHHDEGVNSYFLLNLARQGHYQYNPTNYHGPTLYYFALTSLLLFGEIDLAIRFWPALFGVLTVSLIWLLRRELEAVGIFVAAMLLALSPGLVYFSRDFIHEMSFGCFSMGMATGWLQYSETKKFHWLVLFSISAGLLFATKETAIITAVVMIIALVCATIWDVSRKLIADGGFNRNALLSELKLEYKKSIPIPDHTLSALIIFLFINVFFYTSIFQNWPGVIDAVKSIFLWTPRSRSEHVKSFWYYSGILLKFELPLLIGSLIGGVFAVWRGTRFWIFVAAWTLGTVLAYSIIGYKTPWLLISSLIPMALMSGYAAQQVFQVLRPVPLKIVWLVMIGVILIFNWRLSWEVNFKKYADNGNTSGYFTKLGEKLKFKPYIDGQYGYVYAQTEKDIYNLVKAVKDETDKMPAKNHTGIYIASPDYWPLPWYFRDYDQVAYSGNLTSPSGRTPTITQPVLIAGFNQQALVQNLPGFRLVGRPYTLRPGVDLLIYVRE